MADQKTALAKSIYDNLCATLDARDWKYQKKEDELSVLFGVTGDDIPMSFHVMVDAERQIMRITSLLPFKVPEERRMEAAVAACVASFGMPDGSFDYIMDMGLIAFRMTVAFRQSRIGEELFDYIVFYSSEMVDLYNDKLYAVCHGEMSLEDFIAEENND